jgi:hypothetical protein
MGRKELHYFGSDLGYNDPPRSLDNYLSAFQGAAPGQRVGESSVWYLSSQRAAQEIKAFAPNAQILIMLRQPAAMMHSLHAHQVVTGNEDIERFEDALAAEPDRRAGRRLPPHTYPARGLLYHDIAGYTDQVARFYDAFGRHRVKVVLADDFKRDPPGIYREVLAFLGVRTDWEGFEQALASDPWTRNESRVSRSRLLLRFYKLPINQAVLRGLVPEPLPGWRLMVRAVRRINHVYGKSPPLSPETRARLTEEMAPEVERLSALIDRDLSAWTKPPRG